MPCDLKNSEASGKEIAKESRVCKGPGARRGESEDHRVAIQRTGVGWRHGIGGHRQFSTKHVWTWACLFWINSPLSLSFSVPREQLRSGLD